MIVRTSFFQERQQTLLLHGEKGSIFLPNAFIPSGENAFLFVKADNKSQIEEIENVDQYSLLVQEFGKQISDRQNLNTHYERYLKNTQTFEELLTLRDRG